MRKILFTLGVVALLMLAFVAIWIFCGREISSFTDRYWTVESRSTPIHSIAYEGNGTGGILIVNDLELSLNEISPGISLSVGSTKDNQLALATNGRVFPFGSLTSADETSGGRLSTAPSSTDQAFLTTRHSVLSWPTVFDLNFMTGKSPSWKRHVYYDVHWNTSSGANLEMRWRYEQFFYPGSGWGSEFMTREGSTGLVRIDIRR